MPLDLRLLRYVIAVADAKNISRAAERLHIQQPPLTQQIRALEAELGVALFHRLPRGVEPTEAGRALVEEARAIVARAANLPAVAQRAARGEEGRLAIGFTSSAAFHPFVTRAIRGFRQAWPGVALALEEDSTGDLARALREERLDAVFVRSSAGGTPDLLVEPLLTEEMLAVFPRGHRLARAKTVTLAALAHETFVLYRRPSGPGLYDAIIAACRAAGFSPTIGQEAPRLPSTLSLVGAGLGVSLVPASMRRLNTEAVAYARLTGAKGLTAPLLLATRRGDRSAAVRQFREQMKKTPGADGP